MAQLLYAHAGMIAVIIGKQIRQRLVMALAVRHARQGRQRQLLGKPDLAFPDQFLNYRHVGQAVEIDPVRKTARPEGILIELHPLNGNTAKDYGAKAPVSDGKGMIPALRGALVKQSVHFFSQIAMLHSFRGVYHKIDISKTGFTTLPMPSCASWRGCPSGDRAMCRHRR